MLEIDIFKWQTWGSNKTNKNIWKTIAMFGKPQVPWWLEDKSFDDVLVTFWMNFDSDSWLSRVGVKYFPDYTIFQLLQNMALIMRQCFLK